MLFPEACYTLEQYRAFQSALSPPNFPRDVPILANITEFGQTPLFTTEELGSAGVSMVLYPLSAFRAMVSGSETETALSRCMLLGCCSLFLFFLCTR